jgi:hypothetical protein
MIEVVPDMLHDSQIVKFLEFLSLQPEAQPHWILSVTIGLLRQSHGIEPLPLCNVPHVTISFLLTSSTSRTTSNKTAHQSQGVKIEDECSPFEKSPTSVRLQILRPHVDWSLNVPGLSVSIGSSTRSHGTQTNAAEPDKVLG